MAESYDFTGYPDTKDSVSELIDSSQLLNNAIAAPAVIDRKDQISSSTEDMLKEIRRLQFELDEARSLVAVANYSLEESLETERRKCHEEVATLQQLMKENVEEAVRHTQERSDGEIRRLKNLVSRLEIELHELKSSSDKDNPNVFSAVTKTLARKVGNLTNNVNLPSSPSPFSQTPPVAIADTSGEDYLEQSMKRAQEDVEVLRSLVLPLEEEIKALKDKLRFMDEQLRVYENTQADFVKGTEFLNKLSEDQPLESVVADLITKANDSFASSSPEYLGVFMAVVHAQRTSLLDEKERLRSQLQEACQLLENERRQHRELRRNLQKAELNRSQTLPDPGAKEDKLMQMKGFQMKDKIGPLFSRISPVLKRKSSANSPSKENFTDAFESATTTDNLTKKQPSIEDLLSTSTVSFDSSCSSFQAEGPLLMVEQFQDTSASGQKPCAECKSLVADIHQLQEEKLQLEKQLAKSREEAERLSNLIKDMEHKWTEVAKDYEKQVDILFGNIEELQSQLKAVNQAFKQFRNQAQETLRQMHFDRKTVSTELIRLQEENDFLVGKHSLHAEQLQNEMINLPDNLQELQYVCLNLREDLIAAKVAKEALEKRWQTEVLMLKDQLLVEQQSKGTLENSLTGEIDYLREQLGMMRSVHTQLDEEGKRKASLELALQQTKEQLTEVQDRASQSISIKAKMDNEVQHLRNRVSSLQADLETSEAVQRDFVQLSQQLQVQLEKIRQSEKELRWQYDEDHDNCSECRQLFNPNKRKHHCRHCCQIFCGDCLRKTVTSGPNKRQSKVCNVCYYLLVQDSAPFFSTEPQPSH